MVAVPVVASFHPRLKFEDMMLKLFLITFKLHNLHFGRF